MPVVLLAFLAVFVVAPLASIVVYVDSGRRGLARQRRLRWTFLVGTVSFCGFLLPHLFERPVAWVYFRVVKSGPPDVVTHPREILALFLTLGVAISAASVLLYGSSVLLAGQDSRMDSTTRSR